MSQAKHEYRGRVLGVATAKETTRKGFWSVRFRGEGENGEEPWFGYGGGQDKVQDAQKLLLGVKENKQNVTFDYEADGDWLNVVSDIKVSKDFEKAKRTPTEGTGEGPEEEATDPEKEKAIAEAARKEQGAKKADYRQKRIAHMAECLGDAEKAWTSWRYADLPDNLDGIDYENIRAIANGFMAEDGRKGRR